MGAALGLDGCAGGWFAVCLDARGGFRGAGVFAAAADAVACYRPAAVAVDIPIGLTATGARDADAAARQILAGAASSVFNAPPRAVVDGYRDGSVRTYADANALSRRLGGKGLTQQTWRLVPKIAEIDRLRAPEPLEVHPEVSFRVLSGGLPLGRKKSWTGLARRRRLLAGAGVDVPDDVSGGERVPPDDVLDAAVVAWTAAALAAGEPLQACPGKPRQTDRGRPIAIWVRPRPADWPPARD